MEDWQIYFRYLEDNATKIVRGYKCRVCGKEIVHSNLENDRGNGFMKVSMIGHLKRHWKEKQITNLRKDKV